jgi:hypothetical protein
LPERGKGLSLQCCCSCRYAFWLQIHPQAIIPQMGQALTYFGSQFRVSAGPSINLSTIQAGYDLNRNGTISAISSDITYFFKRRFTMKKVLSSIVAALVAVAFAGVVFAADVKSDVKSESTTVSPAGDVTKTEKKEVKKSVKKSKKGKKTKKTLKKEETKTVTEPAAAPAAK